ncbi:MAG TPA: restriction endonuclease [Thermoanaerobaculia bacterium]|nr:restriction endonuclease [Thermoanaerobaculia bacterium]
MTIWTYREGRVVASPPSSSERFDLSREAVCSYCASALDVLAGTPLPEFAMKGMNFHGRSLLGCPSCGWWRASFLTASAPFETHDGGFAYLRQSCGVLKDLDLTDLSIPVEELRSYLIARYGDRFDVHPKRYEDIVGAVFSDFGFRVRVTSFSGDEGIDVFVLDGNDDATVGIQVKRYKGKISAEQIRSFVGALVLQGLTSGIYVTTSSYERGAVLTANASLDRLGVGVALMDASKFYDALKITARKALWDPEDLSAPYHHCWQNIEKVHTIWGSSW